MNTAKNAGLLRPEDVSEELGMSPTQIRNLMRMGRFSPPIGYAHKTTGKRWRYSIYRTMLDEYLHKTPGVSRGDEVAELAELVRASHEENARLRELVEQLVGLAAPPGNARKEETI